MLNSFGAFADGLAQGIRAGQEMNLRQQHVGRMIKTDEREAELHQARMDKANFYREKRNQLRAANDEITAAWQQDQQETSVPRQQKPSLTGLSTGLPKAPFLPGPRTAGLSDLGKQATRMTSDEIIGKRMLTGNLLENADELTQMANVYKKYGLLEEMAPWMNKAYAAKKKGIPDALHLLLTGDAKGAREVLGKGGLDLADDPIEISTPDEQQNLWRFKFKDGGEKEVNLKALARRFFPSSRFRQ